MHNLDGEMFKDIFFANEQHYGTLLMQLPPNLQTLDKAVLMPARNKHSSLSDLCTI